LLTTGEQPEDRVAVYKFSSFTSEMTDYTASLARLEKAIYMMRPESGTSLYDAIYLAAEHLERREGRKVIIVITDGGDTTSNKKFSEALAAAQRAEAVVYSIIVVPVTADAGRNLGGENALRTISASTGGVCYRQHAERDLDEAFRQIERDLRIQYLLGFYPRDVPPSKDRYYRLEVQVRRPGLAVLARTGYYGEATPSSGSYPEPAVSVTGTKPRPKSPPAPTSQPKRSPRSIP
jgi:Ca-activated chloride channel family protein